MDDSISRQAAIDAINSYMKKRIPVGTSSFQDGVVDGYARSVSILKWLPSAEPQRNKGHWVEYNYPGNEHVFCSQCKEEFYVDDLLMGRNDYPNYCPNCGAEMAKGEEDV